MKKTYGILLVGLMGFALCASGLEALVMTTNSYGRLTWPADSMFTNQNELVSIVPVNVIDIAVINATTNGPNQFAKLDENGKIDASIVETIIVVFAGGEAVDI